VKEMKNIDQVQQPTKKLLWLMHVVGLWTLSIIKKQVLKGLKEIANDVQ
jgi:hypothetical protein